MSAVEEIQAAIDKLTTLGYSASDGPWEMHVERSLRETSAELFDANGGYVIDDGYLSDVELIVTLHRTIDAQIALLTAAKVDEYEWADEWERIGKPHLRGPAKIVPVNRAALELARAINGPV